MLDKVAAAPLGAITLAGFGPARRTDDGFDARRLARYLASPEHVELALDSCGIVGLRVVALLAALGGRADEVTFAAQTRHADPTVIAAALDRLETAGLVARGAGGSVSCPPAVLQQVGMERRSLGDPHLAVNEELGAICRTLGIVTPSRKAERIEAIRQVFADPVQSARVRSELPAAALEILDQIADRVGTGIVDAVLVDISYWELHEARIDPYQRMQRHRHPERTEALHALVQRGIVGINSYERTLWVWAEAWPFLDRPYIADWSVAPRPAITTIAAHGEPAVPTCVGVLDRALARWAEQPPPVLKNGDARLGKPELRALAKALGTDETTVDLVARLAIQLRLLLANEVGRTGRGRSLQIDHRWCVDPDLHRAWDERPARHRWVRLLAEWCRPSSDRDATVLANRHLVLWELQRLAVDDAYAGDDAFAVWFECRHMPTGRRDLALDAVRELRAMGVVVADSVGLTALGRAALDDPVTATRTDSAEATRAFVQADLTVIAPPDLRHDLVLALDRIAAIESTGGVTIYRLDPQRITRAVQGGDTADDIIDMLASLAGTPLPDTVTRLVTDSAAGAAAVTLAPAATVVVVDDPTLLATACAIKALKLTRVAPTVAVTEVALAKVQATLLAKGITPKVTGAAPATPTRSNAALAAAAEQEAATMRATQGRSNPFVDRYVAQLEARAAELRDVDGRFAVPTRLTLTPGTVAAFDGTRRDA